MNYSDYTPYENTQNPYKPYPNLAFIRRCLRWPLVGGRVRHKVLAAHVVGSRARGNHKENSDLDIAVIIAPVRGKTALKFSEQYHFRYELACMRNRRPGEIFMPHYNGLRVDLQFFYSQPGAGGEGDMLPDTYARIPLAER